MGVVNRLREQLDAGSPTQFECGLCTARYDHQPPNCPACGSTELREA